MAYVKPGKNEESCYACNHLAYEVPDVSPDCVDLEFEHAAKLPFCNKNIIDFVGELGLNDSHEMYSKVQKLRDGTYVAIKNRFYTIIPDTDSIPKPSMIDIDTDAATSLAKSYGISITEDEESCPGAVRCIMLLHGVPQHILDGQTCSVDDYELHGDETRAWEKVVSKDTSYRYLYIGTQWEAIVLPYLRDHGCSYGTNLISSQPFNSFSVDKRIEKIAKQLWGNDVVVSAISDKQKLIPCSKCGFPVQEERTKIKIPVKTDKTEIKRLSNLESETRFIYEHKAIDYCMWCAEETSNKSIREVYKKKAKEISSHSSVSHFPISIDPIDLAKLMRIKLYAYFKKSCLRGEWNGL